MTEHITPPDDLLAAMAALGAHEPSPSREALLRARCRASLAASRRREAVRGEPGWRFAIGLALGPAVVGALSAVYLFEVITRAVLLYRF
jgi:class 3 adenylate cyclase